MTPQRLSKRLPGSRPAILGAAVLAAALLGGCGTAAQPPQQAAVVPEAVTGQNAPTPQSPPATAPAPAPAAGDAAPADPGQDGQSAQPATSSRAEQPQVERCHTSQLSGVVRPDSPGAGQRYAYLELTNRSGETCTLYGYGGLQLIGQDGTPLPTKTDRTPNPGPQLVRLAPGESASATLHWTAMPHAGEPTDGPCQPRPASAQVIPPDETDPLTVEWRLGPVCGFGEIDNSAYHS